MQKRASFEPPRSAQRTARGLPFLQLGETPIQQRGEVTAGDAAGVHEAAQRGIASPAMQLPYLEQIQRSFGKHDVSGVKAHVGGDAVASAQQMGAKAYATGDHVVLREGADLHTAAHEAAHVVQQRGGVQLKGGEGEDGDAYERHANEVADLDAVSAREDPILMTREMQVLLDTYGAVRTALDLAMSPDGVPLDNPAGERLRRSRLLETGAAGTVAVRHRRLPLPELKVRLAAIDQMLRHALAHHGAIRLEPT
jgi:hypothetical protein